MKNTKHTQKEEQNRRFLRSLDEARYWFEQGDYAEVQYYLEKAIYLEKEIAETR